MIPARLIPMLFGADEGLAREGVIIVALGIPGRRSLISGASGHRASLTGADGHREQISGASGHRAKLTGGETG